MDTKIPKISIIVPVYKVEKYILRCYTSIARQTYTNIECIFIDDCSPDNSIIILGDLLNQYSGSISFCIIRHDKNKGLSAARNTGINNAKGEYVFFLDSDDEITENSMGSFVAIINKYQGVDVVQGNTKNVPPISDSHLEIKHHNFPVYTEDQLWIKKSFFVSPAVPRNSCNKLIRREFIYENNLYFQEGIIHEDDHFTFFMAQRIKCIAFTSDYCYIRYVDNPSSITSSDNALKTLLSWHIILNDMLANIDDEIKQILYIYINNTLRKKMLTKQIASDPYLLSEYRKIVKKCIENEWASLAVFRCLGLLFFLLPYNIYNSYICRIFIKILLKDWYLFFRKAFRIKNRGVR